MIEVEGEVIITRDGEPVAKLVRVRKPRRARKRFDAQRHATWQAKMNRGRTVRWVDEFLSKDRNAS